MGNPTTPAASPSYTPPGTTSAQWGQALQNLQAMPKPPAAPQPAQPPAQPPQQSTQPVGQPAPLQPAWQGIQPVGQPAPLQPPQQPGGPGVIPAPAQVNKPAPPVNPPDQTIGGPGPAQPAPTSLPDQPLVRPGWTPPDQTAGGPGVQPPPSNLQEPKQPPSNLQDTLQRELTPDEDMHQDFKTATEEVRKRLGNGTKLDPGASKRLGNGTKLPTGMGDDSPDFDPRSMVSTGNTSYGTDKNGNRWMRSTPVKGEAGEWKQIGNGTGGPAAPGPSPTPPTPTPELYSDAAQKGISTNIGENADPMSEGYLNGTDMPNKNVTHGFNGWGPGGPPTMQPFAQNQWQQSQQQPQQQPQQQQVNPLAQPLANNQPQIPDWMKNLPSGIGKAWAAGQWG